MNRSLSSAIIQKAFPNYYQRTQEFSKYYEENKDKEINELPKRSFLNMKSNCTPSNSINYYLPDPETYNLINRQKKKKVFKSLSLEPRKKNMQNTLTSKKLKSLNPHSNADLVKQNFINFRGYNEYSQFSPKKSFYKQKENSKKFTKYLIHDLLHPNYKKDFERVKKREATKLIEKKYQFLPENKFEKPYLQDEYFQNKKRMPQYFNQKVRRLSQTSFDYLKNKRSKPKSPKLKRNIIIPEKSKLYTILSNIINYRKNQF